MKKIELLDCTLRDGGYVNDWKFTNKNLISVFERLVDTNVDYIEIGFLDDRRPFDIERSIMPDTKSADIIFGKLDKKNSTVLGMIDYGTCAIENLSPAKDSFIDGIRVIFKKHNMKGAMEYCRQVKALGYKVFSQLVSITSYTDEDLMELIKLVNDVKPYAVSIVDTYGLLNPNSLMHYYKILDDNVCDDIKIGFHAHNNFQLAYANALTFIEYDGKHDVAVDGTLFGMGKSAGNAPLELVAMSLNDNYKKNYNIDSMLEAIEESIKPFYNKTPWGYKTFFYLSAKNKCHPNYVSYFQNKQNLSDSKVDELLSMIEPEDKKLLYDKDVAEKLYNDYIASTIDEVKSIAAFKEEIKGKKLLLVGPGKNVELQADKIKKCISETNPYVISINYVPKNVKADCVFITKGSRYFDMTGSLTNEKVLATTNVECRNGNFNFVINRSTLLETEEDITDNSFLMLLKFLNRIGVKEVLCAGFDGYSSKDENYVNPAMEYDFIKKEAGHINQHVKNAIKAYRENMTISFITYSSYDVEEDIYSAAI